ncbi:hypothetical protein BOH73_05990 [Pseudomonas versuta]|uniref:Uncharacterized protein n=1 Tax=Pseudomonas versuta TaxID=1788301 RepID=A0ABX3ECJ5_9PSED|nr:hypothetical protein AOC04_20395 [Pseudomonas versuta]OKA22786.1 hypothetical protein BOH73_05990 [Pseudomonas versuta]
MLQVNRERGVYDRFAIDRSAHVVADEQREAVIVGAASAKSGVAVLQVNRERGVYDRFAIDRSLAALLSDY